MSIQTELKKGSIQTLILAVLATGPLHGYGIAREIERRSSDALSFNEGALYPALRSLEREGFLASEWQTQERGPARRVYSLTTTGRKQLSTHKAEWERFATGVGAVLQGSMLLKGGALDGQPA